MEKTEMINKELQKFIQGSRVVEGYEPVTELWNLLCPLFGDTRVLQRTGLVSQINTLKIKVTNEGLIGLIIYGSKLKDYTDRIIDTYPTVDNKEITLTLRSVCNALLDDHMTDHEIVTLLNSNTIE